MLDVRPTSYIAPIAEQVMGPITPIVSVKNFADEDARICALFRIYRESLGILEYSSVSATIELAHGTSTSLAALTPFDPGAPADDDYFILCQLTVQSITTGQLDTVPLGQYNFDVKPPPMGAVPATHHTTHEFGGWDPVDLTGMPGLLADPQTPDTHASSHEAGGADRVRIVSAGEASSATPEPDCDACDQYNLTALADDATFSAPAGTPHDGQKLVLRIHDDGTARDLTWTAGAGGYAACGADLPVTTVISLTLYVGLIFDATANRWHCVAVAQET
jgi:hypothetical protein